MTTVFDVNFENGSLYDTVNCAQMVCANGGTMELVTTALVDGSHGLSITPTAPRYNYISRNVYGLTRFRQRFHFHPNTLSLGSGEYFQTCTDGVFYMGTNASNTPYRIRFWNNADTFSMRINVTDDTGTPTQDDYRTLSIAHHWLELDWKASSAPGANDGFLVIYLDSIVSPVATLANIDNDTHRIYQPSLGIIGGTFPSVTGTILYGSWKGNDDGTPIGA